MFRIRVIVLLFLTFSFLFGRLMTVYASDVKLLIQKDDYRLAKYEPVEGIYLGAYVFQDAVINGDMAKFN
ncbi:hypothetical protein [Calderihabitans maritimus]|uniref:Copper amine oxidase n=1 Tax=Calderihabitans maritimus TaxID=1246530 RepID=A0A1Z5HQ50_9FIRM|nr:hypothetical protein [Calderihabitans maritimus]GAW91653.1 copper amine oxidase [Calderihabitans maritimus]